ncbi:hypothetical protein [Micromonospora tarensis]|uniref:Uncharacterized protein n=1 Tax=Micromonospora tarensis TaxID=2806100 RepID=A0ABS1YCH4_9ACTN|nr:hypothetical protein [Micromonospora tarensis]MBM0275095.1 hypothetical protein [Micromonospora tarensis]
MTYPGAENDPTSSPVNEDMLAVERRRKEREAEYGVWVASQTIPWGTVNAFTAGMKVPASTVQRLKWDELGLVVKRDTKAGREVLERTGTAEPAELEKWAADDKAAAERARQQAAANEQTSAGGATTASARKSGGN